MDRRLEQILKKGISVNITKLIMLPKYLRSLKQVRRNKLSQAIKAAKLSDQQWRDLIDEP